MKGLWTIHCAGVPPGENVLFELQSAGFYWPSIPLDVRIARLEIAGHTFEGFDEYGFQRYALSTPDGKVIPEAGLQVLLKSEVGVVIWELESGRCKTRMVPLNHVTYNPELWRSGARDG